MSASTPELSRPARVDTVLPSRPASERFETLGVIGVGGMARVLLVRDRTLGREVALKVPATPDDARRIEREALVLARLDHPAIVPLFDSGHWDGQPWLALRLVRGETLTRAISSRSPALLRHVLAAAEAVAHAHSRGYVHRDLKPDNIMVGDLGETQVIDWGLALAPDLPPLDGPHAGTASAMSPEQRDGAGVDARSDVWALGALLETVARSTESASPELQAIIARAMSTAPDSRYPDAHSLASDLAAYLDGRRVSAYTYRPIDLLKRTLAAWRRELLIAALCAVGLAIGLVAAFAEVRDARRRSEEQLAVMLTREARAQLSRENRAGAEVLAARAHTLDSSPETRGILAAVADSRPTRHDAGVDLAGCNVADLSGSRVLCRTPASIALRTSAGTAWEVPIDNAGASLLGRHVVALTDAGLVPLDLVDGRAEPTLPLSSCRSRLSRARGKVALAWSSRCAVRISDPERVTLEPLENHCPAPGLRAIGLDEARGRTVAICHDGSTFIDATRYDSRLATDPALPLAFSVALIGKTGETVAIGESHGDLVLFDLASPERHRRHRLHEGLVRELVVSPDGALLAFGDTAGPALFDPLRRSVLWRFHSPRVLAAFDGETLVTADRRLERWDLGPLRPRALDLPAGITAIALSHDGTRAAVGSGTHLYVVDTATREVLSDHEWQDSVVSTITTDSTTGDFIAHGQGAPRIERIRQDREDDHGRTSVPLPAPTDLSLRFRRVIGLSDGSLMVAAFGRLVSRIAHEPSVIARRSLIDLATDRDGLAVVALDEERFLWCTPELTPCGRDLAATAVATADGQRFATAGLGALKTHDFTGRVVQTFPADGVDFLDLAVALRPDGVRVLAGGGRDGSTWLFVEDRPTPWAVLRDHEARVSAVALDPLGTFAIVGGWDGRLVFWPLPTGELDRHESPGTSWGLELDELVSR